MTVIVPEIVPAHRWQAILHGHIAQMLHRTLTRHPRIVVTGVPLHLEK
ncbi:MAG TPA: hypothetical protein VMA77_28330 [Solirubrobacteraceae bacterium]|nr:hypothetical protein [Solirubrobacteraceae bacterium]